MNTLRSDTTIRAALDIERGTGLVAICDTVRRFARPLGYDRFVLFSASSAKDYNEVVDRVYWIEGDWFGNGESVDAETYFRHCPVTRHLFGATEPFFWTKDKGKGGERYSIVSMPRGRGIHGLQVPVFGPHGLEGAMSLGGESIDASPQARTALIVISSTAFRRARSLLEGPAPVPPLHLSKREREVLMWSAAGRRQADIAATLGLSVRTVENHLRRLRQRLGVSTTAQAIKVAIHNGDIEV